MYKNRVEFTLEFVKIFCEMVVIDSELVFQEAFLDSAFILLILSYFDPGSFQLFQNIIIMCHSLALASQWLYTFKHLNQRVPQEE